MEELEIDSRAFDAALKTLTDIASIEAYVITDNPDVEKYWGVLDSGSGPGSKPWPRPGPRTTAGAGGRIFSRQAPSGWVSKYHDTFVNYLSAEIQQTTAQSGGFPSRSDLLAAVNRANQKIFNFLQSVAPVGKGKLKGSLQDVEAQ